MTATRAGFTVLEVLTALVVIGVLVAVAVPTWQTHAMRVRRHEAMSALLDLQRAQDLYFGRHARYAGPAQLSAAAPAGLGLGATTTHGYYSLALHLADDGLAFQATAAAESGTGQSADERCARFTIDNLGQRRAADASGRDRSADCWH